MLNLLKKQSPARIIAMGFMFTILLGSALLMLPFCIKDGQTLSYIDALHTSTSAVCVTGLIVKDVGSTFTPFGQTIIAILIQIGGLGISTIGAGIILAVGKKVSLKGVNIIKEGSNLSTRKGLIAFIKEIFITTVIIEFIGAVISFSVFIQDMHFSTAVGMSLFHSIASFNNAGFDIMGCLGSEFAYLNLAPYKDNVVLNLTTSLLIILGGIGFLVIKDLLNSKFRWKNFSMHTKVVLSMTVVLLTGGTLLLKLTEKGNISWLGAFFTSVSARTAGFSTFNLSEFTVAGLFLIICLMFVGASPGSTGGGIKTTTVFALFQGIKSSATNKSEKAFKYSMPKDAYKKASVIALLSLFVIIVGTFVVAIFEPQFTLTQILFEMTSAFGTVGLSTGITPSLSVGSKVVNVIIMFIGRLGPLTIASLWSFSRGEGYYYPEGNISIG